MLILTATDMKKALPMAAAIEAMKDAYRALSAGQAEVPLRARLRVDRHDGVSLFMPAYLKDDGTEALAVKIVSVFPKNTAMNLPIIHAAVLVLEAHTGRVLAMLEGGTLTAIRTGAGAGAATDLLARPDSKTAALFGAGMQGRTQLEAVCTVRKIQTAWIYDSIPAKAEQLIAELAGKGPIPTDLRLAATPAEAVQEADIIATATTATEPVFDFADLKPGAHVNAVGSYTPEMQEVPAELVKNALVVVDSRSAALAETGDLLKPIEAGLIDAEHIHAEIGDIIAGRVAGRMDEQQFTYFKSVGVAVQDAAAGLLAIKSAAALGLGQKVPW